MDINKFFKKIPNLEGYTIGELRIIDGKVTGIVLINKEGEKRYILRPKCPSILTALGFSAEFEIEDYW